MWDFTCVGDDVVPLVWVQFLRQAQAVATSPVEGWSRDNNRPDSERIQWGAVQSWFFRNRGEM